MDSRGPFHIFYQLSQKKFINDNKRDIFLKSMFLKYVAEKFEF
jgi:hypothetical protein